MRALATAREEHQALTGITLQVRSTQYLHGVTEAVEKEGICKDRRRSRGDARHIDRAARSLIGIDMAASLIERGLGGSPEDEANRQGGGNKA
jgi:hypothetical protein